MKATDGLDKNMSSFQKLLSYHSEQVQKLAETYSDPLENANVEKIIHEINTRLHDRCKIVIVGCGKSYAVSLKLVALLKSLAIPATSLHPIEALHGDMGCVQQDDVVVFVSNSGETVEVVNFMKTLQRTMDVYKIAVTCQMDSSVSRGCDDVIEVPLFYQEEAVQNGCKAPTLSTSSTLILMDCVFMMLSEVYYQNDLQKRNTVFNSMHPGGHIGACYRSDSQQKY